MIDEMQLLERMREEVPLIPVTYEDERQMLGRLLATEPRSAPRRRRRLKVTAAWATCAAAAGVGAFVLIGHSPRGAAHSTVSHAPKMTLAADVLHKAAAHFASDVTPVEPSPTQWIYEVATQISGNDTTTNENWIRFDGGASAYYQNGTLITHMSPFVSPPPAGTTALDAFEANITPLTSYNALASLNEPPSTLLASVQQLVSSPSYTPWLLGANNPQSEPLASKEFDFLSSLLWNAALLPTGAEAAVFNALSTIPGVSVEQGQSDATGRPAIAVSCSGASTQLLLDPSTYQITGLRWQTPPPKLISGPTSGATSSGLVTTSIAWATVKLVSGPGDR
jgi:hypothetical protein